MNVFLFCTFYVAWLLHSLVLVLEEVDSVHVISVLVGVACVLCFNLAGNVDESLVLRRLDLQS
jgi:hypothetical protein